MTNFHRGALLHYAAGGMARLTSKLSLRLESTMEESSKQAGSHSVSSSERANDVAAHLRYQPT